jgi:Putative Flp pilus-assembly TadE/G-like
MRRKNDPPRQADRAARDHGRTRPLATLLGRLRRLAGCLGPGVARHRRASIALVGAAVITMLASLAAVAVDLGTGYLAKVSNQRTADSAAYAGALAYNASSSTTTMKSAVSNLAVLNGLAAGAATASLVASPSGDGNSAVQVTVTTASPLYLAEIFQSGKTLSVTATSYAEVKPNAPACIIALKSAATGVTLSGGTTVTAASCAVASNATVTVPCGTTITTKTLDYDSAAVPSQPCTGIKPPAGTASVNIVKVVTPDPLGGNAAVAAAFAHLASVASLAGPSGPTVAVGTNMTFGYTSGPTNPPQNQLTAIGCTGSFASPTWTVTCPAGGTYHFGTITTSGGIALNFAVSGSSTNTYDISGAINIGGSGANFGPGTYNIEGGIIVGGGSTTTFATGTYDIGAGTVSCNGSFYSICNTGTSLTFGAGSYTIAGGIYDGGGATLSIGAGSSSNSFNIGAGSAGYAINTTGPAMTMGNMTSGTFQAVGKISTGGGTVFTLSAAPAHDLNGTFSLAGSATLGSGVYTVAGNFTLGGGGGGGTVTGSAVTVITSGTFSVAAGYTNVTLTAPGSGTLQDLVVASNGAGGASFSEGASGNSLSGTFYFPSSPITLSGAGSVGNGAGQCLELIGSTITLSGGSTLASTCTGLAGNASGGAVLLVQ